MKSDVRPVCLGESESLMASAMFWHYSRSENLGQRYLFNRLFRWTIKIPKSKHSLTFQMAEKIWRCSNGSIFVRIWTIFKIEIPEDLIQIIWGSMLKCKACRQILRLKRIALPIQLRRTQWKDRRWNTYNLELIIFQSQAIEEIENSKRLIAINTIRRKRESFYWELFKSLENLPKICWKSD